MGDPAMKAARGLILAVALAGCRQAHEPASAPEEKAAPVAVRTARVEAGRDRFVEIPGSVEAPQRARVASRVAALVESVTVEEGNRVRRGQLLVRLDARDLRARAASAEASLTAAHAQRERIRALLEKEAATPQEMEQAERESAAAEAALAEAKAHLADAELLAPLDGLVIDKRVSTGDLAVPGVPLLVVQGAGRLRVALSVDDRAARRIKQGQPLEVVGEDGTVEPCAVSVIDPAADPASRRFLVKCDLTARSTVRDGSFVRVRLSSPAEEPILAVPASAVFQRGALSGVYVIEEGRARLRWIDPGSSSSARVEVRAGLAAGEEVALDPSGLSDGAPVRTESGEAGAGR